MAEADRELAPIDRKALAVLIKSTLGLWTVPDNWGEISVFYFEALEDVPHDLVELALKRLRLNRRWNNFPKPADLRSPIVDELEQRRGERNKIAVALAKARREGDHESIGTRQKPTTAQCDRVSAAVAEVVRNLRSPTGGPDDR